ncbi:hypothetical protein HK097_010719 [Rhizophlyctis rosea]|uniref:Uncharacterized protein n=1 Tax=Rhizophlyctis rosea TaxID=64517 RepID=A0AAD5X4Z0_9FUNG|nr:hypothetical protein HK097_010719 [Rhizophlyctis rosea]
MPDIPPRNSLKSYSQPAQLPGTSTPLTHTPLTPVIPQQPQPSSTTTKPRKKKRKLEEESIPDPAAITAAIQAALAGQRRPPSFLAAKPPAGSTSNTLIAPRSAPSAFATPPSIRVVKPKDVTAPAGFGVTDANEKDASDSTPAPAQAEQSGADEVRESTSALASDPVVKKEIKVPQKGRPKKKPAAKKAKDETVAIADGKTITHAASTSYAPDTNSPALSAIPAFQTRGPDGSWKGFAAAQPRPLNLDKEKKARKWQKQGLPIMTYTGFMWDVGSWASGGFGP